MDEHTPIPLGQLAGVTIPEQITDVRGWEVIGSDDRSVGSVEDLLVDPGTREVEYLIVARESEVLSADGEPIALVPWSAARLDTGNTQVVLDGMSSSDFGTLPGYRPDAGLTPRAEASSAAYFDTDEPQVAPSTTSATDRIEKVNLAEKFSLFTEQWSPKITGELNGQQVKLAKLQGEFDWHHHEHEDELFLVVRGSLTIRLRDRDVVLREGEFLIVPRGVEHQPVAEKEAHVLLFEPASTLNTGNLQNDRTVTELDRI